MIIFRSNACSLLIKNTKVNTKVDYKDNLVSRQRTKFFVTLILFVVYLVTSYSIS